VCPEWDPACEFEPPTEVLTQIRYTAQLPAANTITFDYVPDVTQDVCIGEGPGSCGYVTTAPEHFVITEVNADIVAKGKCSNHGPKVARCAAGPIQLPVTAGEIPRAIVSLPVVVSTRDLNDQFTSIIPPGLQEFAFSIDTGAGQDQILLVDNSGHNFGGQDQIVCGSGNDVVTTNTDVTVAPDCERVTRLT
jgi:hypothetical protein